MNNNAESINDTIKHALDWIKVSLMQLINTLSKLVSSQLENIKQALFGFDDSDVQYCIAFKLCLIAYKLLHGRGPTMFQSFSPTTSLNLRVGCGRDKLMLETKLFCRNQPHICILQKICTTWNKLPYTVNMEENFETFNNNLKPVCSNLLLMFKCILYIV